MRNDPLIPKPLLEIAAHPAQVEGGLILTDAHAEAGIVVALEHKLLRREQCMNRSKTDYYEIDLLRLAGALWKKLWLIVLVTLLCGALAFGYTFFLVTPLYKATAMMYVNNSAISVGSAKVSISAGDLAASQSLVDTYTVILKTRGTLNEVISRTGVPYSYQQLTKMVQAEAVNSTEVFSIDVTSPDPQEAELIANAIADILPDRIADIVEGSSVKIVDYAIVPAEIASPSYTRNTALGMLAGLVVIAAIICLREIFDEKLHSEDDITQRYQLPILAVIPDLAYSGAGAYRSDYEPAKKEKTT